ncbi:MAG: hypothetical protein EOP87_25790 [Verrucomicrobiaceae bacterium]|nr:MAG: hypothetical protein EOP87_25790 [Verrucomicrobiaceae bacterium]
MIRPLRHRVSLWLGLFVTCFLLWASWHSQYHCPRCNLPLGKGRAIAGFRQDRQTAFIYGHKNLSQLAFFSVEPKRKFSMIDPRRIDPGIQAFLLSAQQSGFRSLLIRDSHILTAWFILWLGGLAWQHRRMKRLAPPPPSP